MNTKRFENKIVLVTGAGQGIGKEIALSFAKEGAKVIVNGISRVRGIKSVQTILGKGGFAEKITFDLSKKNSAKKLISAVIKRFGRIDVLINNARSGKRTSLLKETELSWDVGMTVTLKAMFFLSQEAIRRMAKTNGGVIVNIGSVAGYVAGHDSPYYHCAKGAIIQLTRYLAFHGGGFHVRVNCVHPGFIISDEHKKRFWEENNKSFRDIAHFVHPLGRAGNAADVASAVLFLASSDAAFITGQSLVVDGGLTLQDQSNLVYRFSKL